MIGTHAALGQISTYLPDRRDEVFQEILQSLKLVTPEDVVASGLSESLIEFISGSVQDSRAEFDGVILYALSNVPLSQLETVIPTSIVKSYLDYRDKGVEHKLDIVTLLPNLEELTIDGLVSDLSALAGLERLQLLDIRCHQDDTWPSFSVMRSLESLAHIKLSSSASWPFFEELRSFHNIRKLSLLVEGSALLDFTELDQIASITSLECVHIAIIDVHSWPDLAPLGNLSKLKVLEISTTPQFLQQAIMGFDELNDLEVIRINTTGPSDHLSQLEQQIRIFQPECRIQVNTNWDTAEW